ncbi:RND transporter [Profundibacter amoris]|uniref:RND transporter n=1 Tax=Profundibacter amoris TaxID=2171755 RepID=A0A347UHF0_9RHOB|nr:RND transporter [Profundibacter amoris]AXX98278.1 RND transporter [Profundibacter amoris]
MSFLDNISWPTLIMVALLLGLAPFVPEPHVLEKLRMLMAGELSKPMDIFDLVMHGAPWVLVLAKLARMGARKGKE